jgi:hypothetical protein
MVRLVTLVTVIFRTEIPFGLQQFRRLRLSNMVHVGIVRIRRAISANASQLVPEAPANNLSDVRPTRARATEQFLNSNEFTGRGIDGAISNPKNQLL